MDGCAHGERGSESSSGSTMAPRPRPRLGLRRPDRAETPGCQFGRPALARRARPGGSIVLRDLEGRYVLSEENRCDELAAGSRSGLVEDELQMIERQRRCSYLPTSPEMRADEEAFVEIATGAPYTLDGGTGVADVWRPGGKMSLKATGAETDGASPNYQRRTLAVRRRCTCTGGKREHSRSKAN